MIKSYDNIMIVKRCTVIPIEFVVRGFISKSRTETSLYHNYKEGNRNYCGLNFADDLEANEELNQIIFTPTTKGKHDELITFDEIIKKNILNKKDLIFCKKKSIELFLYAQNLLKERGLFLADSKLEFGYDKNGEIILIDEVFTCDSSRYFIKHTYKELLPNIEGLSKENLRSNVSENYEDPYNDEITIPKNIKEKLSRDYLICHHIITGKKLEI
jgi:phosphoribosylaminoimidazole-succinocarboxamide synthase